MESLKDIIEESIEVAKDADLWQRFTLADKENLVRYFRHEFATLPALAEEKGPAIKGRTSG